ncbi:MAG: hypothetical protein PUP91_33570 [Rhizonema sp. PD37]|nr:hypothetical protein [Rhizonema sp. PD37]
MPEKPHKAIAQMQLISFFIPATRKRVQTGSTRLALDYSIRWGGDTGDEVIG